MNNTEKKCPKCNSQLNYNDKTNLFECNKCNLAYSFNNENNLYVYTCKECLSEIIGHQNSNLKKCIYCNSTNISSEKLQINLKPDYIVPFSTTRNSAMKVFEKICKGNILTPKIFKSNKSLNNVRGIYLPFLLCNFDANGVVESDCKKINTWKTGSYKYTKIDSYLVSRGGSATLQNVIVGGTNNFDDSIIYELEPFDYNKIKKFEYSDLDNFIVERFNIDKETAIKKSMTKAKEYFEEIMKNDIKGYDKIESSNNSINLRNINAIYILLPVWLLNIKYNNKNYTFALNGQTLKPYGKSTSSIKNAIVLGIIIFIVILTLLLLYCFAVIK